MIDGIIKGSIRGVITKSLHPIIGVIKGELKALPSRIRIGYLGGV